MRRPYGIRHTVFRLAAGFLLVLTVASVHAQAGGGGQFVPRGAVTPQDIRWVNGTPSGADTRATFGTLLNGQSSRVTSAVPVSSSTLGSLVNGALRRGIPIASTALLLRDLVNGAGWAIDELRKQVVFPATATPIPPGTTAYCDTFNNVMRCTTTLAGARDIAGFRFVNCAAAWFHQGGIMVSCRDGNDGLFLAPMTFPDPKFDWGSGTENPTPVPESQVGNLVKNSAPIVNAILIDPVTGAPLRTQELIDAANAIRAGLAAAGATNLGPDLTVQPDLSTREDRVEYSPDNGSKLEFPEFCTWASVVCDFINWFKADKPDPPMPELPYREMAPTQMANYNSGLGSGSCPAPITVSLPAPINASFQFTYEGICGFVQYTRPLLIAMSWILAAFIVVNAQPRRF